MASKTTTTKRRIAAGRNTAKEPSVELTAAAVQYYVENKKANAATSKGNKARKLLLKMLREEGFRELDFKTNIDGKDVILTISLAASTREVADMDKLLALYESKKITREQFISVTSAGKEKVELVIGKPTWNAVAENVTGEENAKVAPKG